MTPAHLLRTLQRAGVALAATDRGTIRFHAPAGVMTADLKRAVGQCKPDLLKLLRAIPIADVRRALAELFNERAGIAEFDGGMSCADAERIAWREVADLAGEQAADSIAATEGRAQR